MSGCDYCESEEMDAILRRDWAVRVLDAWALTGKLYGCGFSPAGYPMCIGHYGATLEAARHAAALAIWPTLSAEVRAELGECP